MGRDITEVLREWEYDPENPIRLIEAEDGRRVLQVRQPLGIEQYELEGRPDGKRPEGKSCLLDVYLDRLEEYRRRQGSEQGFSLSHEECVELLNEGTIYYYRYLILFQIGDFQRTSSDTDHNLALCDLVGKHGEDEEDRKRILQYRPYIVRMNGISKAMISLSREAVSAAQESLERAIREIETMPEVRTREFEVERIRSLNVLRATLKQVLERKPSPVVALRKELEEAVASEDYERAAVLRDRIRQLDEPAENG
jgi:hypothetical protein